MHYGLVSFGGTSLVVLVDPVTQSVDQVSTCSWWASRAWPGLCLWARQGLSATGGDAETAPTSAPVPGLAKASAQLALYCLGPVPSSPCTGSPSLTVDVEPCRVTLENESRAESLSSARAQVTKAQSDLGLGSPECLPAQ